MCLLPNGLNFRGKFNHCIATEHTSSNGVFHYFKAIYFPWLVGVCCCTNSSNWWELLLFLRCVFLKSCCQNHRRCGATFTDFKSDPNELCSCSKWSIWEHPAQELLVAKYQRAFEWEEVLEPEAQIVAWSERQFPASTFLLSLTSSTCVYALKSSFRCWSIYQLSPNSCRRGTVQIAGGGAWLQSWFSL